MDCLTKAKLFTAGEDGSWTEIGVGRVEVRGADGEEFGGCGEAKKESERRAWLVVTSIDDDEEMLMNTPLVEDDIYVVQHGAILVWSDPEISRDMALSFNTKQGCECIVDDIVQFQRLRRKRPAAGTSTGEAKARDTPGSSGGSGGTVDDNVSPWAVNRENLPTILLGIAHNTKRFGMHVRDNPKYAEQLARLYRLSEYEGDTVATEHIGKIVVAMLGPPFNAEGKILSQFIDNDIVDATVDMVQFAIGRRADATSMDTRRAVFRNPCHLPVGTVSKIHVLHACQVLKDLLPLYLEEGEGSGAPLLGMFLLRFKFGLVNDVCRSDVCLPRTFMSLETHADLSSMSTLLRFLHDISKTIKNAMLPLEPKEELFDALLSRGTLEYIRRAAWALMSVGSSTAQPNQLEEVHSMLAMLCDIVAHMVMFLPRARDEIVQEAQSTASTPSNHVDELTPLSTSGLSEEAISSSDTPTCIESPSVSFGGHPTFSHGLFSTNAFPPSHFASEVPPTSTPLWDAIRLGRTPSLGPCPKFAEVMIDVAVFACRSHHTTLAQSAYDMIYSCGIGLLQGAALQAMGVNIHPRRRQLLRFWCEGRTKSAIESTPLHTLLAAIGTLRESLHRDDSSPEHNESGGSLRALHYLVRLLLPLSKDATVISHPNYAAALSASGALFAVKELLSLCLLAKRPRGNALNAVCSCLSWLTTLINSTQSDIITCILTADLVPLITRLYMAHAGVRPCILASNAANVMHAMHDSIHLKKGGCPTNTSAFCGASPVRSALSSPFVRSLGRDDGLDGSSDGGSGAETTNPSSRTVDTRLVQLVVEQFGDTLLHSSVAQHRHLMDKMRRVISETPEEAQEDVSSRATSTTVERVVIANEDFMALLAEYGPDAPIPEAVLVETVGDVTGMHPHLEGASELASIGTASQESDGEETSVEADPDSGVGFLLRRQKTVRPLASRSRSASPRSRPESPPADESAPDEAVQPPPTKEPRLDPAAADRGSSVEAAPAEAPLGESATPTPIDAIGASEA